MSLTEPNVAEKFIAKYQTWPMVARIAVPLVLLLVLIGGVLFGLDRLSTYRLNRAIEKAKANVNAALKEVDAAKAVVSSDKVDEAVALDHVKQAEQEVIAASNATDQAKAEANAALVNYVTAKNANIPTGTTEADLQRKLDALNQ